MFHPPMACCRRPSQAFFLICNRKYSATPRLIRRTSTVVGLMPWMSAGSSAANSGTPLSDSSRSSFSALNVSRPLRSMSSHTPAANRGSGAAASASISAIPPVTGEAGGGELLVRGALAAVLNVDRAGFDVPVVGGDVPALAQAILHGAAPTPPGGTPGPPGHG